jgi:hypothetical protein
MKEPPGLMARGFEKIPAMTYFRACGHYHRPRELNDRVRNGNECDLAGVVTGKSVYAWCPRRRPLIVPRGMPSESAEADGSAFP